MTRSSTRLPICLRLALLASSAGTWGANAADAASDIFRRERRLLSPPSRSLKSSSSGDLEYRLQAEQLRINRLPAGEDGEELPSTGVLPMNSPKVAPGVSSGAAPRFKLNSHRRDRFSSRRSSRSFDGARIFGVGFVGAGAYGIFGTEVEFSIDERTSFGLGLGTGMTYSTWGLHGRYFFNSSGRMNTFFQGGYAHWYLGRTPASAATVKPNYLAQRFFYENGALKAGKGVDLVYPGIGVQFLSPGGLAFSTQLQYLISLRDFSGGLFGALAFHFYF